MDQDSVTRTATQLLALHEGLRLKPYRCPAGKLTIGYGRNLESLGITKPEAKYLLDNDVLRCRFELERAVPGFLALSPRRQIALIDLDLNLGLPTFLEFKRMLAALSAGDFNRAADELHDSEWARQVGARAERLARMMREG
jgi:lysozyme